jgi:hypothetical protein
LGSPIPGESGSSSIAKPNSVSAPTSKSFADAAAKANAGLRVVNIHPRLQNGHAAVEVTVRKGRSSSIERGGPELPA